jgi:hypothetical protein
MAVYTTINDSGLFMNTVLYTGNASTQSITGVGFQPDWTWIKSRAGTHDTENHGLFDAVRTATKRLMSNSNDIEYTTTNSLTAFDADGFSLGDYNQQNGTGTTYASWNWKANGAGSANAVGDIASTVSVNTTSGFSIVKFTGDSTAGQTVGHGLGVVPKLIIVKNTAVVEGWSTYHASIGNTGALRLDTTSAEITDAKFWNDTSPTSSLFTVGNGTEVNGSGNVMIAYCFSEIAGYSKFGIYTGNGSSTGDGSFINTGFKPAFIMVKRTNGTKNWHIFDTTRSTSNLTKADLKPNLNVAEDTSNDWLDILSNGFKWRIASGDADYADVNGDGDTYVYAAFAEAPFVNSNGVPCNAR